MDNTQKAYLHDSDEEPMRLELQASLADLDGHLARLALNAEAFVMDAGCGSGAMSRTIAKTVSRGSVIGVDINPKYLPFARQAAGDEGIENLNFIAGNIFHLPFADKTFDLVWSKYVLRHVRNPVSAVTEFRRVTRPGGYVVCCDSDGINLNNYPVDSELQRDLEYLILEVLPRRVGFDPLIGRKLHWIFHHAGLEDIQVDFEKDQLSSHGGRLDDQRIRRNWEIQITGLMPLMSEAFGSLEQAEKFVQRFFAYLDREDTYSYCPLFFAKGRVP